MRIEEEALEKLQAGYRYHGTTGPPVYQAIQIIRYLNSAGMLKSASTAPTPFDRLADASERIAAALENITTAFQTADATDTKPSPPAGVTVEED